MTLLAAHAELIGLLALNLLFIIPTLALGARLAGADKEQS